MGDFTNSEKEDVNLVYSAADGNSRGALRLYRECFPNKLVPNRKMFAQLHRYLCENGIFRACIRVKLGRTRIKMGRHQDMRKKPF